MQITTCRGCEKALEVAVRKEESPLGREILMDILKNAESLKGTSSHLPGYRLAVIFLELGQDVRLVGGDLNEAINEGVRRGYRWISSKIKRR